MTIKAISLISGGLDSTLATKVVMDQGVEVVAANFVSPFCQCSRKGGCRHEAQFVSEQLKIPLRIVNATEDFLKMLKNPKHGYGSNILMLKKAKDLLEAEGASFLVTGEVLGQRPMSQRRDAMRTIEKEAGVTGLVLRPLSARLLEPTIPEEKGWVDREKLLDISGRSRKPQMKMAQDYNISDYPCPAGGCLLTDPGFARRIKDLIAHDILSVASVSLLNHGRHFRLSPAAKIVVGRDERDNNLIASLAKEDDFLFFPEEEVPGATSLGKGDFSSAEIFQLAARLAARYFDKSASGKARVVARSKVKTEVLEVVPLTDEEAKNYII
jgi:tRNA-specific 2-thiouridylase